MPGVVALLDVTKTGVIFEPNSVAKFKPPKVCPGRLVCLLYPPDAAVAKSGTDHVVRSLNNNRQTEPNKLLTSRLNSI